MSEGGSTHNDIIAIEQLLQRLCHAVDGGELDHIMQLFHSQATLRIQWEENGVHKGRDAVQARFDNYINTIVRALKYLRHNITSPFITVTGLQAVAYSYLTIEAGQKENSQRIITVGRYEDKFATHEGRWLFEEKIAFMDAVYQQ